MTGFKVNEFEASTTPGYAYHFRCQRGLWQDMRYSEVIERCPFGIVGDLLWCLTLIPVEGYESSYAVGDDGCVYRIGKSEPKKMRPGLTSNGYQCVTLCKAGSKKTATVHTLVCNAFYGKPPSGLNQVRHLDGDKSNNKPENLDWSNQSQNNRDRSVHGTHTRTTHHASKLTESDVEVIKHRFKSQRNLAKEFGVSQSTISDIQNGKTWGEVKQDEPNMPRWASRINLEITGVRVERLNEISEADAHQEGVIFGTGKPRECRTCAKGAFMDLWESINGAGSWAANPWVWVLSFQRIEA